MKTALVLVSHALISSLAALAIAPYSADPIITRTSLWMLALGSAAVTAIGFFATAAYLSKRPRPGTAVLIGYLCGLLCAAISSMTMRPGTDFSLILYLAVISPMLLSVLLATLLDRPKSGWQ